MRGYVILTVVILGALWAFDLYKFEGRYTADIWRQTTDVGRGFSRGAGRGRSRDVGSLTCVFDHPRSAFGGWGRIDLIHNPNLSSRGAAAILCVGRQSTSAGDV